MAGRKKPDFGKAKRVDPIIQVENEKGIIAEKMVCTTILLPQDLIADLKTLAFKRNVTVKEFLDIYFTNILENQISLSIPKAPKYKEKVKFNLYMSSSKRTQLKEFLLKENINMTDLIIYLIQEKKKDIQGN